MSRNRSSMRRIKEMSFWGKTLKAASVVPASWAGVSKGLYDAATGKASFDESANETFDKITNAAENLGDEHGKALTNTAIGLAGTIGGTEYKKHRR